jgi:hypothetical protein
MGACDFRHYEPGTYLQDAYRTAVRNATDEFGSDGYNGTISTTNGAVLGTRQAMTRLEANRFADDHLDDCKKWENAGAVAVLDDSCVQARVVEVTATLPGGLEWEGRRKALDDAAAQVTLKASERVFGWEQPAPGVRTTKTSVRATAGKTVTRYYAVAVEHGGRAVGPKEGFASQAEARAYAKQLIESPSAFGSLANEIHVEGRIRRESGEPLVIARRDVTSEKVPLRVTVGKVTGDKVAGFLFYGMAAI